MKLCRQILLSSVAASAIGVVTPALAQSADETTDVIVVTGQRSAITNALDEKENADGIIDALSADDVGRFPDPNIAESLARLPGVAFQRENDTGQGEFISIRGLDATYNTVLFDGVRTGTADPFRRTALDIVTANNISSVRVTKTPLPQDYSEGIGGIVDIRTRGPLSRPERTFVSIDARDVTFADDTGFRVNGGITKKFSDRLAANFSASYREIYLNTLYANPASFTLEQVDALQVTAADGRLATFIDEAEIDLVPDGFVPAALLTNEQINFEENIIKRDNLNIAGAIDFQLTENTLLTFGGRYTRDETTQTTSNIEFDADNGDIECLSGEFTSQSAFEDASPFDRSSCSMIGSSNFPDPEVTFEVQIEDAEEIQERYFVRGLTEIDAWTFEYTAGYSRAYEDEPVLSIDFTNDFDDVPGGSDDDAVTFVPLDFSNPNFPAPGPQDLDVFRLGIDPFCENADESNGRCGEINDFDEDLVDERENERYSAKFDGTYEFAGDGIWQNVKFGLLYETSTYNELRLDISDVDDSLGANGEFLGIDRSGQPGGSLGDANMVIGDLGIYQGALGSFDRIDDPYADIGLLGVPLGDPDRIREIRSLFRQGFLESGSDFRNVEFLEADEEFYSAYVQGKWTFDKLDIIGGLRIEQYEGDFSAPADFTSGILFNQMGTGDRIELATLDELPQANTTTENFEVLPRVIANYNIRDNMKLRAAYTTAIARPTFDLLAASVDGSFNIDLVDGVDPNTATFADVQELSLNYRLGNPDLDNAYSTAFDLSWEWYINDDNAISIAVFHKKIEDFIFNTFALEGDFGVVTGDFDPLSAVQSAPFSADGLAFIDQLGGFDQLLSGVNADILVRAPANGDEATVTGIEATVFHNFTYLPGVLANTGFAGNATWQETETTIRMGELDENDALVVLGQAQAGDILERDFDLFNSPDLTGNFQLFYEDRNLELMASYRYAGLTFEEVSSFGFGQYVQERGFLDLRAEYSFHDLAGIDRTTFFFFANDVLDDGTRPTTFETNDRDGRIPNFSSFNGREFRVGMRLQF